jgi:hypothetical protein
MVLGHQQGTRRLEERESDDPVALIGFFQRNTDFGFARAHEFNDPSR